jgi:copper(I)-binding protein
MRHGILACALFVLAACGNQAPPLSATDVVVTEGMGRMNMSAGYMTMTNNTGDAMTITHVTSPQFGSVEMHETVIENDVARMRRVEELVIPARGQVRLERGGKHLMLMKPTDKSKTVTLNIYSGDVLLLHVNVAKSSR